MPGVSWTGVIATVHMNSGADWTLSVGDSHRAGAAAVVRRDSEVVRLRPSNHRRSWPFANVVPRHASRISAGHAGCDRDLLPAGGDEFFRRAWRLCGDFALGQRDLTVEGVERVSS